MADQHTCNSNLVDNTVIPIGTTDDGKILNERVKRTWCSICGGNGNEVSLGTFVG